MLCVVTIPARGQRLRIDIARTLQAADQIDQRESAKGNIPYVIDLTHERFITAEELRATRTSTTTTTEVSK